MNISSHLLSFIIGTSLAGAETTLWVTPSGNDVTGSGAKAAPVATIQRASELVRAARAAKPAEPVTVWLGEGTYPLLNGMVFGEADSGTAAAPVVWRGADRDRVRIIGARQIAPEGLKRLKDPALIARLAPEARDHVLELDLDAEGVRHAVMPPDYQRDPSNLCTLFYNGKRLPLSRWPNGTYGYTTMKSVVSSGSLKGPGAVGGVFEYRDDRPERWQAALADGGVWVRGFWRVPWVAETLRVKGIDPKAKTISLAVSPPGGIGSKYSKLVGTNRIGDGKENWFAFNLLDEIDQPGEWAVDFKRRKLYIWPPSPPKVGSLIIADNAEPLLSFSGASHIMVRDVTLGFQMGEGVSITGGEAVQLAGCQIEGIIRRGIVIRAGRNHRVQSCDISEIGLAAIDLLGGDRATLKPSGHAIINNHIWHAALNSPVPALIAGLDSSKQQLVGARIANNRIHDVTYSGVHFAGNDNVLEYNELYRLGLDGGDLGGFYTTGGWTSRGNVVRRNFIHHSETANAIYMDDGSSGLLVEDNLIYRTGSGVFIGGGHDHIVRGNVIVKNPRAFHIDDRGVARKYVADDRRLRGDLNSVPYLDSPWRERYPALVGILESAPDVPHGNVFTGNFAVNCETLVRRSGREENLGGFAFKDTVERAGTEVFADVEALDFTPSAGSGFPAMAMSRFGLQLDEFRRTLPARDMTELRRPAKGKTFDSQQDVDAYQRR
jgi:hypothetical protein